MMMKRISLLLLIACTSVTLLAQDRPVGKSLYAQPFAEANMKELTASASEIAKGPAGLLASLTDVKFDGFRVTSPEP